MKHLLAVVIFLVSGSAAVSADVPTKEPTVIGVVLPLSGEFASWGERIREGLLLAAEDTSRRFTFDFQDEGNCEAKNALSAVQKLAATIETKVFFMGCLAGTKASGPVIARMNGLMLSTGLLDEAVFRDKLPIVNLATQLSTESKYLAKHMVSEKVKRVAVLRWPEAFGEEFARTLTRELEKSGLTVAFDDFSTTASADFRSVLLRAKQAGVDAFAVALGDQQIRALMKQLSENGGGISVYSNYVVETNTPPAELPDGIEYTYPLDFEHMASERAKFEARHRARFGGGGPSANTYFAYDGLRALDAALAECPGADTACIRGVVMKRMASGLSGDVRFDSDGSNIRPYGIKHTRGGKYLWLDDGVRWVER